MACKLQRGADFKGDESVAWSRLGWLHEHFRLSGRSRRVTKLQRVNRQMEGEKSVYSFGIHCFK
jgi:hypothetical protein